MVSLLADRELLYIFKSKGCAACEASEVELATFESKHPTVMVLRIDAAGPFPAALGVEVKATPTWGFRRGQEMVTRVGFLKAKEIEAWLKKMEARL
jgi:hypothetical protein